MAERLNRAAVIARAADLADDIGLNEVTITKLGRSLGIAPPGVYRHVIDLTDLRAGVGAAAAREVTPLLAAACTGLAGQEALLALGNGLRAWARAHPGRYSALQIAPEPENAEGQDAAIGLLAVMSGALRGYSLEGDNLTDAIRMLRSVLHGFISLELGEGFKDPRNIDESFRVILLRMDLALRAF